MKSERCPSIKRRIIFDLKQKKTENGSSENALIIYSIGAPKIEEICKIGPYRLISNGDTKWPIVPRGMQRTFFDSCSGIIFYYPTRGA